VTCFDDGDMHRVCPNTRQCSTRMLSSIGNRFYCCRAKCFSNVRFSMKSREVRVDSHGFRRCCASSECHHCIQRYIKRLTEESVSAQLCEIRLCRSLGQQDAIDSSLLDALDVIDLDSRHVLHGDNVRSGHVQHHLINTDCDGMREMF
jgi:hypothetical protein